MTLAWREKLVGFAAGVRRLRGDVGKARVCCGLELTLGWIEGCVGRWMARARHWAERGCGEDFGRGFWRCVDVGGDDFLLLRGCMFLFSPL